MPTPCRIICILCLFFCSRAFAGKIVTVSSPDARIIFSLSTDGDGLYYRVTYKSVLMVDRSRLNISFKEGGPFGNSLIISSAKPEKIIEDYDLLIGKTSKVHSESNRIIVPVAEQTGTRRQMNIEVRVFNDGVAFRYTIPAQKNWAEMINITDEADSFNLTQNPVATVMYRVNYTTSHEGLYSRTSLRDLKADTLMDMPALFEFPGGNYMAITEANLHDYAGMYLMKHNNVLESRLSPCLIKPKLK